MFIFMLVPVLVLAGLYRVSGVLSAAVVKDVKLGDSITLPCTDHELKDTPVEQLDVQWRLGEQLVIRLYRGQISYGINYSNRTELPAEGSSRGDFSLIITHTQHGDSGVYQCVIRRENQEEPLGEVELRVKVPRSPSAVFVKVGEEAVLPCFGRVDWLDSEAECVQWMRWSWSVLEWVQGSLYVDPVFSNRLSLPKEQILKDDLSLILKNTRHSDQGQYHCSFINQGIQHGAQVNLTVTDHLTRVEAGFGSSVLLPLHTAAAVSVWFLPDGGNDTVRRVCEVEEDQLKCEAAYTHRTLLHTLHTIHNNSLKLENLSLVDSGTFSVIERERRHTLSVLLLQVFTTPPPAPAGISGVLEIITAVMQVMLSLIALQLVIFLAERVIKCIQQSHRHFTEKQKAAFHRNLINTGITKLLLTYDEQPTQSVPV